MAQTIFVVLFFTFLITAVNFPCNQITSETGYTCEDVGWCYRDRGASSGACIEDPCMRSTEKSDTCTTVASCSQGYVFYDLDCSQNNSPVNQSGFYCAFTSWHYDTNINGCFYNGSLLTGGKCEKGCKYVSLGEYRACIVDKDYDHCNDFDSEDWCHFMSNFGLNNSNSCFWQNGKCVTDQCRKNLDNYSASAQACSPNTSCVARDRYTYSPVSKRYSTVKMCMDPAHTTYQKCGILINEPKSDTGFCKEYTVHSDYCTGQTGCKVITYEGFSECSSWDNDSSSDNSSSKNSSSPLIIPSIFALLIVVLAWFFSL